MRKRIPLSFVLLLLLATSLTAQVTENFTDGDFTTNPAWVGSSTDWIVNPTFQLQSNNMVANSTFYLSTANTLATEAQWEFYVKLTFNTSSANYLDVFLTASASDLTAASTNGYFIRIGGTQDEISLYKKSGATSTKIIDGVDATTNTSSNTIKIKVTRDAASQWLLYRDLSGAGTTFFNEGSVTDNTFTTSAFFGVLVKQSTVASFAQRHFFDDIVIQPFVPDITAPAIVSATVISANTVDILFNEPLDNASSQVVSNYIANNALGSPATAVLDGTNTSLVHLIFAGNFTSTTNYLLTINGVRDLAGNAISNGTTNFSFTATPPVIQSAFALSSNSVDVLFNEPLSTATAQTVSNYVANNSLGSPTSAILDGTNRALVHLTFGSVFLNGTIYQLTVNGVTDLLGSPISNGTANFSFYTPQQYDIVIDEIIADQTPQVALPNSEWIELKNTTAFAINLQGWKIGDGAGISGGMPNFILQPDSFVIVCTGSAVPALAAFGTTISVSSFPSLDNDGELLYLSDAGGRIIHSVNYSINWYQNELKKGGGWTLEMIDTKNPCSGFSNWKASTDTRGGTPGKKNSVDGVNADQQAPKLLRAYATDNLNIVLAFDEPLDAVKAAAAANYSISDGVGVPVNAVAVSPGFDGVSLQLASALAPNKVYTVTASSIADCVGNLIGSKNTARVGLSAVADSLDVVINEILFNPPSSGNDYVEIYNRSNKIIDLKQTYIANRSTAGLISSIVQLSAETYLLFPQDFMVVTANSDWVKTNFITLNPDAFVTIGTMPSYNDTEGDVIILNAQGSITDELKYTDKWHFKLLDNKEGVALERIDYNASTQSPDNWHSAASSVNYGTPAYKNSQFRINDGVQGEIKLTPEIVSPDNDGQDDFATIDYRFPEAGYVASITIFDASGRPVRYLQRNALCGTNGSFRWDGLGERSQQLSTGVYVIYTEVFNLNGKKKQFKTPIVVARRN